MSHKIHGMDLVENLDAKKFKSVGHNVEKVDGVGLVTGTPCYVDDFTLPRMLYAKIKPSPHAHAVIKAVDTSVAEKIPGVVCILHPFNVPRVLHTTAGQGFPEPSPYDTSMFDTKVRFVGDKVAVVAAETEAIAAEAVKKIQVEYEMLDPVFDVEEAISGNAPVIHDEPDATGIKDAKKNLASQVEVETEYKVAKAIEESDVVVEGRFDLGYAQHCPLEPHSCISYLDENRRLVIRTATQVPFHARRITAQVLQMPIKNIRVIKPRVGGGFGAKQEVILEYICGAITMRTGRPCRIVMTRSEEFVFARTRHPHVVWVTLGAKKDGMMHAIKMRALSNSGAYGTHALTVVCNAGSKTLPLYNKAKGVYFLAQAGYTNSPVGGAYRGYGGTQGYFALECLMDELAEKLGIDPCELRKMNHIKTGESSPIFAMLGEGKEGITQTLRSCELAQCIETGARAIDWKKKREAFAAQNGGPIRRGIGMCTLMQGSGIPEIDMAAATIRMNEDGSFQLRVGATDIGTGSDTVLAQIAAEALSVPSSMIQVTSSDTDNTPFDVGAYASSTTYISGGAVKNCAYKMREVVKSIASEMLNVPAEKIRLEDEHAVAENGKKLAFDKIALRAYYSQNQQHPTADASFYSPESPPPFAAHFVEVEVDTETGHVRLTDYVAAVDCGVAIHPRLAEGQVEGAVLNGISYALTEEYDFDETGRMTNSSFSDYKIFSTRDFPPIRTFLVESYEPTGPFGAKSIAEININGPIPAIANAIYNAVGVRMKKIPYTPERVLEAIRAKG